MKRVLLSLILLSFMVPIAYAHHSKNYYRAKVVNTTPVYRYKTVNAPREVCYRDHAKRRRYDRDAVVAGRIVGGALGYVAGEKGRKGLTTLAGAVIGGVAAKELTRGHSRDHGYCETHYRKKKVRVLKGYNVAYRYKGRVRRTFRENHPGKRIRIYY
jgi:uncharacterized protein YcfJ